MPETTRKQIMAPHWLSERARFWGVWLVLTVLSAAAWWAGWVLAGRWF